jgi:hypothetical protein
MSNVTAEPKVANALFFLDVTIDVGHGCHHQIEQSTLEETLMFLGSEVNADSIITDWHGVVPTPVEFVNQFDKELVVFEDNSSLIFSFDEDGYVTSIEVHDGTRVINVF